MLIAATAALAVSPAAVGGDGFVDGIDYDLFSNWFEAGDPRADVNGDGFVDGLDYDTFMNWFANGDPRADINGDG